MSVQQPEHRRQHNHHRWTTHKQCRPFRQIRVGGELAQERNTVAQHCLTLRGPVLTACGQGSAARHARSPYTNGFSQPRWHVTVTVCYRYSIPTFTTCLLAERSSATNRDVWLSTYTQLKCTPCFDRDVALMLTCLLSLSCCSPSLLFYLLHVSGPSTNRQYLPTHCLLYTHQPENQQSRFNQFVCIRNNKPSCNSEFSLKKYPDPICINDLSLWK